MAVEHPISIPANATRELAVLGVMSGKPGERLGEILLAAGYVTPELLAQALELQRSAGGARFRLGEILVSLGVPGDRVQWALGPDVSIGGGGICDLVPPDQALRLMSPREWVAAGAFPYDVRGETVCVATADVANAHWLQASLAPLLGIEIRAKLTSPGDLARTLEPLYRPGGQAARRVSREIGAQEPAKRVVTAGSPELVGKSTVVRALRTEIQQKAPSGLRHFLVTGESGTGKELVARMIHEASGRPGKLVAVHLAYYSADLLISEIFGAVRGGFTDARDRAGRIAAAEGKTLLLDEIGRAPLEAQTRLLRFLEDGVYKLVGSNVDVSSDILIVFATDQDLDALVAGGQMLPPFCNRLKTAVRFHVPPLRAHAEDVPEILEHLIRSRLPPGRSMPSIAPEVYPRLALYHWPADVRDLVGLASEIVAAGLGHVSLEDVARLRPEFVAPPMAADGTLRVRMASHMSREILAAAARHSGNHSAAARELGISRTTLLKKLRDYGLDHPRE